MCILFSQRVKSGIHQSSLTLCDMFSSATSSSLSFFATSITSLLDLTSQEAEGNRDEDLCLADCNSVDKSETTAAQSNKPACASFPALEEAEMQDCICPQPVPEGESETSLDTSWDNCQTKKKLIKKNQELLNLNACFGRDAARLVENFRHRKPAQSGQGSPLPGYQRKGAAETDPKKYGAYDPDLGQQNKW